MFQNMTLRPTELILSRRRLTLITLILSPYRSVHTLCLSYTNQSVNVVWGNNGCLFLDPHKHIKHYVERT